MHSWIYPVCATVCWVAVIYKLVTLRRDPGNEHLRAVCVALVCLALAFTVATPGLYGPLDRLLGWPNMTKLVVHGAILMFAATGSWMILLWTYPPAVARGKARRRFLAAAVVLMVMAFLLHQAPVDAHTSEFTQRYAATPWAAQYLLLYVTAIGVAMVDATRLFWTYSRAAERPWLARGLRLTSVGTGISTGYCLTKGTYVVGRNLGQDWEMVGASSPAFAGMGV